MVSKLDSSLHLRLNVTKRYRREDPKQPKILTYIYSCAWETIRGNLASVLEKLRRREKGLGSLGWGGGGCYNWVLSYYYTSLTSTAISWNRSQCILLLPPTPPSTIQFIHFAPPSLHTISNLLILDTVYFNVNCMSRQGKFIDHVQVLYIISTGSSFAFSWSKMSDVRDLLRLCLVLFTAMLLAQGNEGTWNKTFTNSDIGLGLHVCDEHNYRLLSSVCFFNW